MVCLYGVAIEPGNYARDSRFLGTAPYRAALEESLREIVIYPIGKY